jgi:hypothetical protein
MERERREREEARAARENAAVSRAAVAAVAADETAPTAQHMSKSPVGGALASGDDDSFIAEKHTVGVEAAAAADTKRMPKKPLRNWSDEDVEELRANVAEEGEDNWDKKRDKWGELGQVMWHTKAPRWVQDMLAADDEHADKDPTLDRVVYDASTLTSSRVSWLSPRHALKAAVVRETSSVVDTPVERKKDRPAQTNKGADKRRQHRGRSDRTKVKHRHRNVAITKALVRFEDLSPARCYVADAATRPSESARARAEELRIDKVQRYAQFGRLDPATGLRYAPVGCEYAGDIKVAKQIKKMIANPYKVQKYVGIFELTDHDHPAYIGRKSDEHPPYGALALRDLPSRKVLGAYGGLTKLDTEDEQIDSSSDRADCQFGLHVDQLFVDADKYCNELAFFNDFRTDTVHYNDPKRQKGYRKCKSGAKNSRYNTEVVIAWKDNDLFPRVFFITNRAVRANEELMINYVRCRLLELVAPWTNQSCLCVMSAYYQGDAYWMSIQELKQSENTEGSGGDPGRQRCGGSDPLVSVTAVDVDASGAQANTSKLTSAGLAKPECVGVEDAVSEVLSVLVHTIIDSNIGTDPATKAVVPAPMCSGGMSSDSESEIDLTGDTPDSSDEDMPEMSHT